MIARGKMARIRIAEIRLAESRVALAHAERAFLEARDQVRQYRDEVHSMEAALRKTTA